ncbi:MAG: type II secretion system F family protein [Sedimentisphaerales bacterium]|nr:type II secretion system F family protein [Sedimentisphaerales bacterium]
MDTTPIILILGLIALILIVLIFSIYLRTKKPALVVVGSFLFSFLSYYLGNLYDNVFLIAFAIALFVVTIPITLIYQLKSNQSRRFFSSLCILTLAFILLPVVLFIIPGGIFGNIFFILVVAAIIRFILISKESDAGYIISIISSAIRQNLPLAAALEQAAANQTDKRSKILQNIAHWLEKGFSLTAAIKAGFPKCPAHALNLIALAEPVNQLPAALVAIEKDLIQKSQKHRQLNPVHPIYPLAVIAWTFIILSGIMYFVIPKYEKIFMDFNVELPLVTRSIILPYWGIQGIFWPLLFIFVFIILPYYLYTRFRPRRSDNPYVISILGDFLKWHLPILHWFEKNYSLARVIQTLRLAINAGQPINTAIAHTLNADINHCFRKRLKIWHQAVESGQNISTSARQAGLGSALAWAFDTQVNQANTPQILEMLDDFYRTNYSYAVNLARYITWPCIIVAIGTMVGLVVYGLFKPLVVLIETTMQLIYT